MIYSEGKPKMQAPLVLKPSQISKYFVRKLKETQERSDNYQEVVNSLNKKLTDSTVEHRCEIEQITKEFSQIQSQLNQVVAERDLLNENLDQLEARYRKKKDEFKALRKELQDETVPKDQFDR